MHAGDLTPEEAYELLEDEPQAVLVDVRTAAEWTFVGVPDLREVGRDLVTIEWSTFPGGRPNPAFLDQLADAGVAKDAPVLFLCRSGARSAAAAVAATQAGWERAHNVSGGFEGDLDGHRHRGVGGWKAAGLPWAQS
jgi:rhodanese-related sulfurtransferase